MNILSFARKEFLPEMPPSSIVFSLPSIDLVLDCASRVAGSYHQGRLRANVRLSPNELAALLVFYQSYPCYAPDVSFFDTFGSKEAADRAITQMRSKLHKIGFSVERMRETGYFLIEESLKEGTPMAT
jgi:hypothetical protein